MSVYIITGKLGNGKTLAGVGRIREYLQKGKRVATNLDLYPHEMLHRNSKSDITRLPDKPRVEDLEQLGTGDNRTIDEYDEDKFGCLVLDELASWLNARTWNDKERANFIEWLLHARKYHWDVYLIIQNINAIDKQVKEMFCEHLVICRRLDKIALPLVGGLVKLVTGKQPRMPKLHVAAVYYGDNTQAMRADRWVYRGTDLYKAYRTGQQFTQDVMFLDDGNTIDMRASYTVLPPYYTHGRYWKQPSIMELIAPLINPILNAIVKPIMYALAWLPVRSAGSHVSSYTRSTAFINGNTLKLSHIQPNNVLLLNDDLVCITELADRRKTSLSN